LRDIKATGRRNIERLLENSAFANFIGKAFEESENTSN
jgi:hypothetical protein